jgi:hypothetical protein
MVDAIITSPFLQLIKAELAPLAGQMHEQYSVDYIASHMYEALGEELLAQSTDAERKKLQKDWLARFEFFKVETPIPDELCERCFAADAKAPLTARGEAVKIYGAPAVLAQAKKWGFSSLTALKPTVGPSKTPAKTPDTSDASKNPWSDKMRFRSDAERLEKQLAIIKLSTKLASGLAKAAGKTISNQPLRK